MGYAPRFMPTLPVTLTLNVGSPLLLNVDGTGIPADTAVQWWRNGVPLQGATNLQLSVTAAQTNHSGVYSITAINDFGAATTVFGSVSVLMPDLWIEPRLINGDVRVWMQGTPGQRLLLESTTDFRSWTPLESNVLSGPVSRDFPARTLPFRFFRARPVP
jgi:hypothetical protein